VTFAAKLPKVAKSCTTRCVERRPSDSRLVFLDFLATSLLLQAGAFGLGLAVPFRKSVAFLTILRLVQADSLERVKISQAHRLFSLNHAQSPHVILLSAANAGGCVGLKTTNLNLGILQHNSALPRATSASNSTAFQRCRDERGVVQT
jgi:hypothetical protein